jgi:hypothetical protein
MVKVTLLCSKMGYFFRNGSATSRVCSQFHWSRRLTSADVVPRSLTQSADVRSANAPLRERSWREVRPIYRRWIIASTNVPMRGRFCICSGAFAAEQNAR